MNYQGVCLEGGSEVVAQVAVQRSNFTMVPNILIDAYDEMSDACRFGFIKFMRLVRKEGCFVGSLRKLGKKLKIANMTINRMVRAWERFILVAIERLEDTDLVRITPLLDSLWGANTDHYMYAPAELREHVTNCDTHTTATDRVVTECVNSVTKRDGSVTNCDTVSQPQAQNGGEYITKSNEEDSKRLLIFAVVHMWRTCVQGCSTSQAAFHATKPMY